MKKLVFAAAGAAAIACCGAYSHAPARIMTPWGEKVAPDNAWRGYPRPQMVRAAWTNLNGLWKYAIVPNAQARPRKWDGEILVPFPVESALSGVGRLLEPDQTIWYNRSFDAKVKKGERLILHFEQSDFRTMLWVNGVEAGLPHEGGQLPFSYDITDLVRDGANDLTVAVWDPTTSFIGSSGKQSFKPSGCFYTRCSGIGGTVWMETVPEMHIAGYKVTPDIDAGKVRFEFDVAGPAFRRREVIVSFEGRNHRTRDGKAEIALPAGFKLWSPESPHLYRFTAKCGRDSVQGYFGMRKIEVKKDANGVLRIFFNNEPRFPVGTLDQGWWPDGLLTPPSDEAMAFDIRSLKEMGFDMMRKHIKIEPRRYYWLCDTLGILVMQDMPSNKDVNNDCRYGYTRREMKEIVDSLYNSPSVVAWIPYNEAWGQPGPSLTKAMLEWVQRYDPSRIVDGPSGWNDYEGGVVRGRKSGASAHRPEGEPEAAHLVDRHDYGQRPRMLPVNPRRASFLGEFGGIGCRVEGHLWTDSAWGYGNTGKDADRAQVQRKFVSLMDHVAGLASEGLAGSVYTQTTDVEGEINGLLTYDRKVRKFDAKALSAVHARVRSAAAAAAAPHVRKTLAPKLDPDPRAWAWTTVEPPAGWQAPGFDDSAWKRSAGGFGANPVNPDQKISTPWTTPSIWLRRRFSCTAAKADILGAALEMFHDEDADVYLNGKPLLSAYGYNTGWTTFRLDRDTFLDALKDGENVLAAKVVQTAGGQYFDTGVSVDMKKKEGMKK